MQHTSSSSRDEGTPSGRCLSPQSQLQHPPLQPNPHLLIDNTNQPMLNYDGTEMRDEKGRLVYKSQFLSTHPLKGDCKERVGYGGKKFTYVSGDGVIRTMNAVFGFGGWSSRITMERMVQCEKDDRGRWNIGYLATVKVTLRNGVSHEDCGSGDGINESKVKAHEKAMKSAVTDAMKRAARHFGERLGNALYIKGNGIKTAPKTNKDALIELEKNDALNLFGDQALLRANSKIHSPLTSMRPSLSPEGRCAASNDLDNVQKENLHHNRRDLTPVSSSTDSRNTAAVGLDPQSIHPQHTGEEFILASSMNGGIPAKTILRGDNRHHINSACHHNMPYAPNLMHPPQQIYNTGRNGDNNAVDGASSFTGIRYSNTSNICYSANQGNVPLESSKRDRSRLNGDDSRVTNSNGNGGNSEDGNKRQKKNPYSRLSI